MVNAHIFLITKTDVSPKEISAKFLNEKNVKDVVAVYGKYDAAIKVKFDDLSELSKFIKKIRKVSWIETTVTLIAEE